MTLYYVRKGGNDGNDGLSAALAHAWLTIDHAANVVAAGDTVHIGAGVYRELVTMDTAGVAGSLISFLGDVTGAQTGDAGPVIVTCWNDEYSYTAGRAAALELNQKEFVVWKDVIFIGGTSAAPPVICTGAGNVAMEGCVFQRCVFVIGMNTASDATLIFRLNLSTTPATLGPQIIQCIFVGGGVEVFVTNNAVAHVNAKMSMDSCILIGGCHGASQSLFHVTRGDAGQLYSHGGFAVRNCTSLGGYDAIYDRYNKNLTHVSYCDNTLFYSCYRVHNMSSSATGAWVFRDCIPIGVASGLIGGTAVIKNTQSSPVLLGCMLDLIYMTNYGWSPYRAFEPISIAALAATFGLNQSNDNVPTADLYGDSFAGSLLPSSVWYGYFDGSDAAATDPNAKWNAPEQACDTDYTTWATISTTGSDVLNYMKAEGSNAPARTGTITQVRARVYSSTGAGPSTLRTRIYTDALAETLATIDQVSATLVWSAWTVLAVPAAGWTWATVAALEFKAWREAGANSCTLAHIQIEVTCGAGGNGGAVNSRNRPAKEIGTPHTGVNAMHFTGAGWHDLLIPVNAVATTVTVYGRFDGNYGGASKPQMIAMNIPGVADQTATMTAAANTWQQITVNFTPSAQGICRVRLKSRDTSGNGLTIFDDLRRA
jgi:hypothetical protein